jgi:hypothetical protein
MSGSGRTFPQIRGRPWQAFGLRVHERAKCGYDVAASGDRSIGLPTASDPPGIRAYTCRSSRRDGSRSEIACVTRVDDRTRECEPMLSGRSLGEFSGHLSRGTRMSGWTAETRLARSDAVDPPMPRTSAEHRELVDDEYEWRQQRRRREPEGLPTVWPTTLRPQTPVGLTQAGRGPQARPRAAGRGERRR